MPKHNTKSAGILEKIDADDVQIRKYAKFRGNTHIW